MIGPSSHPMVAFQHVSALPLQTSIGQFGPRADKEWWPSTQRPGRVPAPVRSRPTVTMALGFSASAALLPKQFLAGSVVPALQGLGELLPAVGAPMLAVLCLSAASWLLSLFVSFLYRSFSLWWTMAVRSQRALPSEKMSLNAGSAVQIGQLKEEYQRVSAVRAQALNRINELSQNLDQLQEGVNGGAQTARARVQFLEARIQAARSMSSTTLGSAPTAAGVAERRLGATPLGNVKSAAMERSAVASVALPDLDIGTRTVGDQWEVVMESGNGGKYALLRHVTFKTSIELPLFGTGVLFAGSDDSVVRRCWADGTLYERFAFHTGRTLLDGEDGQAALSRKLLSDPDGVSLGSWLVVEEDEYIMVRSSKHDEELVLLRDGFAFFGGGSRGVVVRSGSEPEVERTSVLRGKIGLPASMEAVAGRDGGASASAAVADGPSADDVPQELVCPLSHAVMSDPWIASDGFSYERAAIEEWFARKGARSPTTGLQLPDTRLVPNNALRSIIATYVEQ